MNKKMVTVKIGGYTRRCPESRIPWVYEEAKRQKKEYMKLGVPAEELEKLYEIEIVQDED